MEPDFSGYATKNGLKCSDGRTILAGAFKHQDGVKVPLVWQHRHDSPDNILGHVLLTNKEDGVWADAFFNSTSKAEDAKIAVMHGDLTSLSIFANQLVEKSKQVLHGMIREVSLVLAGANPEAQIINVNLAHGDGFEPLLDEAVIFTGLEIIHSDLDEDEFEEAGAADDDSDDEEVVEEGESVEHADVKEKTMEQIYADMTDEEKGVVEYIVGKIIESTDTADDSDDEDDTEDEDNKTNVKHDDSTESDSSIEQSVSETDSGSDSLQHNQEGGPMTRNVFEQTETSNPRATLSHDQLSTIVEDIERYGSLSKSFLAHAEEYGIEDIDFLFPDAKALSASPEFLSRRMEWVKAVIDGTRHSPFSRIKSVVADITADEARAKGYVKASLKKDEVIKLLKRVTTPTTIYKKQKLDRDDVTDITDIDVIAWLKAEMRVMLDEELARAILLGDGREADDPDKIDEDHLRPIAKDVDMYAHKVTVASNATPDNVIEAILRAHVYYRGSGRPTFYTTGQFLTDLMLSKDKIGRRLYNTEAELAAALRVAAIVEVEPMVDYPDIVGIMVNLADYTVGADKGGQVSMFDDFDLDYNQLKYLLETRASGALTKPKAAVVINRQVGTLVNPTAPSYNASTHVITIPSVTGVTYLIDGGAVTGNVTITETTEVEASADTGYTFPSNTTTSWTFVYTA